MQQAPTPRWLKAALASAVALVMIAIAGLVALRSPGGAAADGLPVLATMPDFHLIDQTNQPVAAADLKGKVLLIGFIYTTCDDICPVVTAQMKRLQQELAEAGLLGEAELLSISVDPEQDTPERLDQYARQFQADTSTWRFLTGKVDYVREVVIEGFLLGVQKVPATGHAGHSGHDPSDYRVTHSGRIALVDQSGGIRAYFEGTELEMDQVVAAVRSLVEGRK